jgi:ankyrin repeat protein
MQSKNWVKFLKAVAEKINNSENLAELLKIKNNSGDIPLHTAAQNGENGVTFLTTVAEILKDKPNDLKELLEIKNGHSNTPLHEAASKGNIDFLNAMSKILNKPEKLKELLKM